MQLRVFGMVILFICANVFVLMLWLMLITASVICVNECITEIVACEQVLGGYGCAQLDNDVIYPALSRKRNLCPYLVLLTGLQTNDFNISSRAVSCRDISTW